MFEGFALHHVDTGEATIRCRIGGTGPPLLLLHGNPQTHVMWHTDRAAAWPRTSPSSRPTCAAMAKAPSRATTPDHEPYSKRAMARDQVARHAAFRLRAVLGRRARPRRARAPIAWRSIIPNAVEKLAVLDILPTLEHYRRTEMALRHGLLALVLPVQPYPLPEKMIGGDPEWFFQRNWPGAQRAADILRSRGAGGLLARLQRPADGARHLRGLPRRRDL